MAIVHLDWSEYAGGVVTVGNFDGVHRGHQALLAAARKLAARASGSAVVVTFDPPPHQVLHPGSERPPLTTIPQRAELLHALGADHARNADLVVCPLEGSDVLMEVVLADPA